MNTLKHLGLELVSPRENTLLGSLPDNDFLRLLPHLEPVAMKMGEVLYACGSTLRHAYFPTTAVVSKLYVTEGGESAEIAVVGNEGMLGVSLFMGGEACSLSQAVVQCGGYGYRVKREFLKREFAHAGALMRVLLRYTQALITQMAQTAVCNRHHSVEQQLCRWLLQSQDRRSGNALAVTHELIAHMLGVRREGISEAAAKLQRDGLIHYSRGNIELLSRTGLEARSCECYQVVKLEFDRLFPLNTVTAVSSTVVMI